MNLTLDIQVADAGSNHPLFEQFEQWVTAAIGDRLSKAQLSVRLVTEAEIKELNTHYRAQAKATNVLSFPADIPDYVEFPLLGDLAICSSVVQQEAKEQNKTWASHWAHLVIHGTLHLLGYDHINDNDADIMETLEIDILNSLGFPNPYLPIN